MVVFAQLSVSAPSIKSIIHPIPGQKTTNREFPRELCLTGVA